MCGIGGYSTIGKLSPAKAKIRANIGKAILIANESRGTDSTGLYLQNGSKYVLSKDTCLASDFVRQKDVIKLFEKNSHLMLGHTRQATQGVVSERNAHPFEKGNIVGVHNGVIFNDAAIATEHDFDVEVDSEVIFELLNKYNNDFKKAFKEIRGSASVAWINALEPKTLFLMAHDNPLVMAQVPSLKTIFFCSEFIALDCILSASVGVENYYIEELKEDTVYKIAPDHQVTKTKVKFAEFSTSTGGGYWGDGKVWDSKLHTWVAKKETEDDFDDEEITELAKKDPPKEGGIFKETDNILSDEEFTLVEEICQKQGCLVCKTSLNNSCYFDDEIADVFCWKCIKDEDKEFRQIPYVYVDLKKKKSHYYI